MKTNILNKRLQLTCLLLLTSAAGQLCNAQITTDLTLWLKADSLSTGTLNSWSDASGAGGSGVALTASGSAAPTVAVETALGGKQAVEFNGANVMGTSGVTLSSLVNASSDVALNQGAIFMVVRSDGLFGTLSGQTPIGWGNNPRLFGQTIWSTPTPAMHFQYGDPGSGGDITAAPALADGWHIVSMLRNGTAGAIRVDGQVANEGGNVFFSSANPAATGDLAVGASSLGGDNLKGAIAEVLVYRGGEVLGNPQAVENYLGTKYGLAVVPEPSQYAILFGLACVGGALAFRHRRQPVPNT
jgi:hypothetical protein